eukprot:g18246.t1
MGPEAEDRGGAASASASTAGVQSSDAPAKVKMKTIYPVVRWNRLPPDYSIVYRAATHYASGLSSIFPFPQQLIVPQKMAHDFGLNPRKDYVGVTQFALARTALTRSYSEVVLPRGVAGPLPRAPTTPAAPNAPKPVDVDFPSGNREVTLKGSNFFESRHADDSPFGRLDCIALFGPLAPDGSLCQNICLPGSGLKSVRTTKATLERKMERRALKRRKIEDIRGELLRAIGSGGRDREDEKVNDTAPAADENSGQRPQVKSASAGAQNKSHRFTTAPAPADVVDIFAFDPTGGGGGRASAASSSKNAKQNITSSRRDAISPSKRQRRRRHPAAYWEKQLEEIREADEMIGDADSDYIRGLRRELLDALQSELQMDEDADGVWNLSKEVDYFSGSSSSSDDEENAAEQGHDNAERARRLLLQELQLRRDEDIRPGRRLKYDVGVVKNDQHVGDEDAREWEKSLNRVRKKAEVEEKWFPTSCSPPRGTNSPSRGRSSPGVAEKAASPRRSKQNELTVAADKLSTIPSKAGSTGAANTPLDDPVTSKANVVRLDLKHMQGERPTSSSQHEHQAPADHTEEEPEVQKRRAVAIQQRKLTNPEVYTMYRELHLQKWKKIFPTYTGCFDDLIALTLGTVDTAKLGAQKLQERSGTFPKPYLHNLGQGPPSRDDPNNTTNSCSNVPGKTRVHCVPPYGGDSWRASWRNEGRYGAMLEHDRNAALGREARDAAILYPKAWKEDAYDEDGEETDPYYVNRRPKPRAVDGSKPSGAKYKNALKIRERRSKLNAEAGFDPGDQSPLVALPRDDFLLRNDGKLAYETQKNTFTNTLTFGGGGNSNYGGKNKNVAMLLGAGGVRQELGTSCGDDTHEQTAGKIAGLLLKNIGGSKTSKNSNRSGAHAFASACVYTQEDVLRLIRSAVVGREDDAAHHPSTSCATSSETASQELFVDFERFQKLVTDNMKTRFEKATFLVKKKRDPSQLQTDLFEARKNAEFVKEKTLPASPRAPPSVVAAVDARVVARHDVSITSPTFGPNGELFTVSRNGDIYRYIGNTERDNEFQVESWGNSSGQPLLSAQAFYSGIAARRRGTWVLLVCNARLLFDPENVAFVCDCAHQAIFRIIRTEDETGGAPRQEIEPYVKESGPSRAHEASQLLGPNSVCMGRESGLLYFTDSGPLGETSLQNAKGSVFAINPATQLLIPLAYQCTTRKSVPVPKTPAQRQKLFLLG